MTPPITNGKYVGQHSRRCSRRTGGIACPNCDLWFSYHKTLLQKHIKAAANLKHFYACVCGKTACTPNVLSPHLKDCPEFLQHLAIQGVAIEFIKLREAVNAMGLLKPRFLQPTPYSNTQQTSHPAPDPVAPTLRATRQQYSALTQHTLQSPLSTSYSNPLRIAQTQPQTQPHPQAPIPTPASLFRQKLPSFAPGSAFGSMTIQPEHGAAFLHVTPQAPPIPS